MAGYDGPLIHVDWEITPAEWESLKATLLANRTPFVDRLIEDGALG